MAVAVREPASALSPVLSRLLKSAALSERTVPRGLVHERVVRELNDNRGERERLKRGIGMSLRLRRVGAMTPKSH